ncbi:hypothetical protein NDU88_005010 [Pleurodeles waltl]|uniref:Uncharacterized protein n=1 Tax=Pleurodeles waltl TaxID=8319 RepID=A0AAV7VKE6_PLEWA|nr:hypothetical protein NDU88_005010 [Pleurodeles waltl]
MGHHSPRPIQGSLRSVLLQHLFLTGMASNNQGIDQTTACHPARPRRPPAAPVSPAVRSDVPPFSALGPRPRSRAPGSRGPPPSHRGTRQGRPTCRTPLTWTFTASRLRGPRGTSGHRTGPPGMRRGAQAGGPHGRLQSSGERLLSDGYLS